MPLSATAGRQSIAYLLRAFRWQPLAVAVAVALPLTRLGNADVNVRAVLVVALLGIGAAFAFDDSAAVTLGSSPSSLGRRRAVRVALLGLLLAAAWLPLGVLLAIETPVGLPVSDIVVVLATVVAVVLAVAARVVTEAPTESGGAVAAAFGPLFLVVASLLPARWALFPVEGHEARWLAVLLVATGVVAMAGRDPARRRVRGRD